MAVGAGLNNEEGRMKARWVPWVWAVGGLLAAAMPVWADEADNAGLKAEIEVLKARLAKLEGKLDGGAEFAGTTGIGEKAGLPTLELPSGLKGLAMSGYADVSAIYNFAESDPGSGARTNRGRIFDTEPGGFTPHAFELVLEKPMTDEMPIGFRTDLAFGDDAEVVGASTPGLGLGTDELDIQQLYVT